jgi:hypothetical protein
MAGDGTASDEENAARAEEVRAWLVLLRGGAPFLSSADGRLLATWLDAGVPVPTILHGIERVAERRRARRTRTPFTLVSCRGVVEKIAHQGSSWRVPADLAAALVPAGGAGDAAVDAALAELAAAEGADPAARAELACGVLRRFHAQVWASLGPERDVLLAAAADEIADLRGALPEDAWHRACEEIARDRVRARYPSLSATRVWEEFGLGME